MHHLLLLLGSLLCLPLSPGGGDEPALAKKFKTGVEQHWAPVGPKLYAHIWETFNLDYAEMLYWLEAHGETEKLAIAQPQHANWMKSDGSPNSAFIKAYHLAPFHRYPVVNVSHAAARLYCDWLTEMYANNPKRKYERVRFRLPTAEEWTQAARAGNTACVFPWDGPYLQDCKAGWRANFKVIDQQEIVGVKPSAELHVVDIPRTGVSEVRITTAVDTYSPNAYGIYNLSGNVAEMLAEPGRTKGGSWETTGYYLRIDAEDAYAGWTEPQPGIGFRVFIEVLEE